ncbi:hypothetical protein [Shewanella decolorationis]|uniref:hypothetical protein n=1 Tax=Shewanella decolorationis TaxID=256839 RepID=UPI001057520F|nr:hypothetical protein [Shewanella decolorationis]
MKKTSLALIAAMSMLGSVAANANPGGTVTGGSAGGAAGGIVAGGIAAGAVVAGVLVAANAGDDNPISTSNSNSTSVSSN